MARNGVALDGPAGGVHRARRAARHDRDARRKLDARRDGATAGALGGARVSGRDRVHEDERARTAAAGADVLTDRRGCGSGATIRQHLHRRGAEVDGGLRHGRGSRHGGDDRSRPAGPRIAARSSRGRRRRSARSGRGERVDVGRRRCNADPRAARRASLHAGCRVHAAGHAHQQHAGRAVRLPARRSHECGELRHRARRAARRAGDEPARERDTARPRAGRDRRTRRGGRAVRARAGRRRGRRLGRVGDERCALAGDARLFHGTDDGAALRRRHDRIGAPVLRGAPARGRAAVGVSCRTRAVRRAAGGVVDAVFARQSARPHAARAARQSLLGRGAAGAARNVRLGRSRPGPARGAGGGRELPGRTYAHPARTRGERKHGGLAGPGGSARGRASPGHACRAGVERAHGRRPRWRRAHRRPRWRSGIRADRRSARHERAAVGGHGARRRERIRGQLHPVASRQRQIQSGRHQERRAARSSATDALSRVATCAAGGDGPDRVRSSRDDERGGRDRPRRARDGPARPRRCAAHHLRPHRQSGDATDLLGRSVAVPREARHTRGAPDGRAASALRRDARRLLAPLGRMDHGARDSASRDDARDVTRRLSPRRIRLGGECAARVATPVAGRIRACAVIHACGCRGDPSQRIPQPRWRGIGVCGGSELIARARRVGADRRHPSGRTAFRAARLSLRA